MTALTFTKTVNASKENVWRALADLGAIVQFHPFVTDSYYHTEQTVGVGAARVCEFGDQLAVLETASAWKDGESYTLNIEFVKGTKPPMDDVRADISVAAAAGGTEVRLVLHYSPKYGPVGFVVDHMMLRKQYGRMIDGMMKGLQHHLATGEQVDLTVLKRISTVPA